MRERDTSNLSSNSPIAIVMVGLPGSGKSFFAEQFAKAVGLAIASQDRIRWMLFATHTYEENENDIVRQVDGLLIEQLFRTRRSFVIDGGYNTMAERNLLRQRCRRAGYKTLFVVVQTDLPTAKHRAMNYQSDRNPVEIYNQDLTPELFDRLSKDYQAPTVDNNRVVVISGKHNFNAQARNILKHIMATNRSFLDQRRGSSSNDAKA